MQPSIKNAAFLNQESETQPVAAEPENGFDKDKIALPEQEDVVQKQNVEKNEEFAVNKRRDRDVLKGKHVDMVNVGKELKITLDDVDTKVRRGDPEWKRQQK